MESPTHFLKRLCDFPVVLSIFLEIIIFDTWMCVTLRNRRCAWHVITVNSKAFKSNLIYSPRKIQTSLSLISHNTLTEIGKSKHNEIQQVTWPPAKTILPLVSWLRKNWPIASAGTSWYLFPDTLQLPLIDLQSNPVLNYKFNSLKLNDVHASFKKCNSKHPGMGTEMLVLFGLINGLEQKSSVMNFSKAR